MRPSKARTAAPAHPEGDRRRVDQLGGAIGTEANPERQSKQESYRTYPTVPEDEAERIRAQVRAHAAHRDRLDHAATLFLKTVGAEGYFVHAGREFLDAADGLNRQVVIERAADKLAERLGRATQEEAHRAVWTDARRIFGWRDHRDLEVGDSA
jgi:hypothetical protein